MTNSSEQADGIASEFLKRYGSEAIAFFSLQENSDYTKYQDDPAGFIKKELGISLTPDIIKMAESVRDNRITIARSATGTGKSQPVNTPILTPGGYVPMGDIKIGDFVYGSNGLPVKVVGVFPQGIQPTYRIYFSDGFSVLCSGDHLWSARSKSKKSRGKPYLQYKTTELSELLHRHMHIPMCGEVCLTEKEHVIDPYVMGALIGDGTLGQYARLECAETWIEEEVRSRLPDGVNLVSYRQLQLGITTPNGEKNPILTELQGLGLIGCGAKGKFIPEKYLFGSVAQRKLLLAGLVDTDGTIDKNSSVSFDTISPILAEQFVWLIQSLGGTAKTKTRYPTYTHNDEKRIGALDYRISIKISFCPFMLPRKVSRWRDPESMHVQAQRIIDNIMPVEDQDSVCIKVDSEDGLYLTEHFIVTHNSHGGSSIAAWFYKAFPNSRVYTIANPYENQKILWSELSALAENNEIFREDKSTTMHIERSSKDFITALTVPTTGTDEVKEGKFSGKHHEHMLFIVDEGDTVPDFAYRGIEGCMSGGHVRMLVLFNPRYEAGTPYRHERERTGNLIHLSAFNHPNVITGKIIIPGAVDRETTVQRINEWCRPLVENEKQSINTFELPDFLVGAVAKKKGTNETYEPLKAGHYFVNEQAFFYMVLGIYSPQPEQQLISREWINNARARWDAYVAVNGEVPPAGVRPIIGGDIAEQGRDFNTRCARYGGFVSRIKKWNGIDTDLSAEKFIDEYKDLNASIAYIDATGIGSGVAPKMRRDKCVAVGVKVAESPTTECELGSFAQLRDQLYWSYREWLRTDPGAMLPPDERLIQQSLVPTYSITRGKVKIMPKNPTEGKVCMRDLLKCSPDELDCVVMTFAGGDNIVNGLDLS